MEEEKTDNMFTVLPMSQRIKLKAGETAEGEITVVNPADATEDFTYKAAVAPYGVIENDHADYTIDLAGETTRTQISKWIKIDEPTGKIKPNESKKIHFTIKVPKNAPAGGQYAAISISSNQDSKSSEGINVKNVFEMASIIYATVDGETKHEGEILENNIPSFIMSPPATLGAMISNGGNVHEDATFVITVSDFFTGHVILPTEEETGQYSEIIMPETTRYIEREVDNLPALGVIKVSQTIYYQGKTSTSEGNIIICPIWFLILVLITLGAIIATVIHLIRKHHHKKSIAV
ncbi:DUF916 domain-containing protein [Candidatus Saccharibacteria bacterium]|nr:DUF916 domain-containing protein [Candidatus Saccharibacteria bacterium]